jgi:multimeric flavodoxin WrbA
LHPRWSGAKGGSVKLLGLVGSPRKGGNTDTLVDRVMEGAKSNQAEVEKVYLRDLDIHPCQGAFSCEARKRCVLPDDMQPLYEKIQQADGIVIGTPVYVGNATGALVNFLGRCRPFISFLDSLEAVRPALSPSEEALRQEKTCLQIWQGKSYADLPSLAEEVMLKAMRSYVEKNPSSHPIPAKRLAQGKKGVILLTYHQPGEKKYQGVADFLNFNLHNLWGLEIIDLIPAYRLLKKGDAQMREDLMQRAWKAGQLF